MKKIIRIIVIVMLAASFTACEQLAQIASQAAQVLNLKNCNFDVSGVDNINMLGMNLSKGMDKSNLNATQLLKVTNSLLNKKLPLHLSAFLHPGWSMAKRFIHYASPVVLNELMWGTGTALLTIILGYMHNSVEMLAAYSVTGNLGRLFLVVCFGLGAATSVMVGNAIGKGESRDEVMDLSLTLLDFTTLVGACLAAVSLLLVPILFRPVVFPLFKLYGSSAVIATALAITSFAATPLHAYAISAVTGVLRAGGDVRYSTMLDVGPQWLLALPVTALSALVLGGSCWIVALAIQSENALKVPLCMWRVKSRKWIHDVTEESL